MSTALYRRYRPETFADVIGQEHVTEPLMAALRANRVTHAYLFSGPRGCGKTTSARILARCLNCAQGPTDTPCGTCDSCVELARGGPGSLDVVEIDAASHNGVDDARELRERAAFAPARDRYKIFILDEAHMVTTQGFNALLKLVEEPPAHVKFVFATTEPDKVIGTIRSRTHHYPFRLVPPEQLTAYLDRLAVAEEISVASGVLPLVVRAGGGSVRDSLSVLDQLIAGADAGEVTYERAVALLGFTHGALLDDAIDALAARDGASLFRVVERVIDSGHAPRRFVEDLLERMRDLIVVLAAGEQAGTVLRAVPEDQLERMRVQSQHLGLGALSRAADLVNLALTEMVGATSPRLQLELLCARLLLPAADDGVDGFNARLDRLEGALSGAAPLSPRSPVAVPPAPTSTVPPAPVPAGAEPAPSAEPAEQVPPAGHAAPPAATEHAEPPAASEGADPRAAAERTEPGVPSERAENPVPTERIEPPAAAKPAAPDPVAPSGGAGGMTAEQVRRRWPEVLETLTRIKRTTWALISQDAQVVDLTATNLALGFSTSGLASAFRNGPHGEHLQRALSETLGLNVRIDAVVADGSAPAGQSEPTADRDGGSGPDAAGASGGAQASVNDAVSRAEADWGRPAAPAGTAPRSTAPEQAPRPQAAEPAHEVSSEVRPEPAHRPTQSSTRSASPTGNADAGAADAEDPEPAGATATGTPAADDDFPPPPWDIPEDPPAPTTGEDPPSGGVRREGSPGDRPGPMGGARGESGGGDGPTPRGGAGGESDGGDRPTARGGARGESDGGDRPTARRGAGGESDGGDRPTPTDGAGGASSQGGRPGSSAGARPPVPEDDIPPAEPPDFDDGPAPDRFRGGPAGASRAAAPRGSALADRPSSASARDAAFAAARAHTSGAGSRGGDRTPSGPGPVPMDEPDMSDPDIESSSLIGAPLVARLLGGTVIDEITETTDGAP
ncbi:DNA polymerase III subunit gamma and tau [Occultella glacieicola]|uniref:DNA-directed DNA polymerase n=1 Tax=Occultella glacieicola TaxID=2518684 RepID=A0ABY2DY49_9MICO|nr:DNA polymerase III subunit gamma and tau [Occultella glacieicola]TDE89220.1 DNA polymerase III subunit gamma and tau [Occultella glacieicola]